MKVLIISQYYPPDMGGGATRAQNAARGLVKNGCDVTVIAASPHYPTGDIPKRYRWKPVRIDYDNNLRVIRTFVPPLSSTGIFRRFILFISFVISSLFALFTIGGVDIVWAANPNIMSVFPGLIYSRVNRCPLVQNVDDLWPEAMYDLGLNKNSYFAKLSEFVASFAYSLVDFITPISPGYLKILVKKYRFHESQLRVIKAGVDLDRFTKIKEKQKPVQDKRTILYIGAFSPAYDFDQIFKAATFLSDIPNIQIVIRGGGELAPYLRSTLDSGDYQNVILIDKIVDRQKVADFLIDADILLLPLGNLPMIDLGISSKLYEYQAAGKPIICCSNGYPGLHVSDSKSGIVVPPSTPDLLAEAIVKLLSDSNLSEILGTNGRKYAEQELDIRIIGSRMKELFQELLV